MKMNLSTLIKAGVAVLLCVLMLLGTTYVAAGAQGSSAGPFDYSASGAVSVGKIDASALLERFFGVSPTPEERAYLDEDSGLWLTYNDLIPGDVISTEYNGDLGSLEVIVPVYSYLAANGVRVEWIPTEARLEGESKALVSTGSDYRCRFEGLLYSDDFELSVSFSWKAEIEAEHADLLLTAPYADGSAALEIIEKYERTELEPYLAALEKYNVYTAYLQAIEDRAQYLLDKAQYDVDLQKYLEYTDAFEKYSAQLAAYELRQKYEKDLDHWYAYQDFLKNDLENYNAYLNYRNQMSEILAKLNIMESMFTVDSHSWQLYGSMMGDTVASVVERRSELITAGCDPLAIETAGASTKVLRGLLQGYADLRNQSYASEYARVSALYGYYTDHYAALRSEFAKLYGALKSLYGNEIVVIALIEKGKIDHFQQFVGQLYVIATCLDDDPATGTRLENWTIGKKKLNQVVEKEQLLIDTGDADPKSLLLPEREVERVEAVEPIEKPTVIPPEAQHPGDPPKEVKEPVEPTFVPEPDTSNPPPEADDPGEMPAKPEMSESLWNLAIAIRQGSVRERTAVGLAQSLTMDKTVTCPISIHNLKTVTFYDTDGTTVLYRTQVDYGGSVTYRGPSMKREDPNYTYEFLGWVLADGSGADYSVITSNLSVYASYRVTPAFYRVTWVLDGVTKVTSCAYGLVPECPFSLTKADTKEFTFAFSGWDREVVPVTGNVTYRGSFIQSPRLYTVTWILGDRIVEQKVPYGSFPVFEGEGALSYADETAYYQFLGWDKPLNRPVHSDVTYVASYAGKTLAMSGSGSRLTVTHSDDLITVHAGMGDVFLTTLATCAQEHQKDLCIQWDFLEITIHHSHMEKLLASDCKRVNLRIASVENGLPLCSVILADGMNEDVGLALPLSVHTEAISRTGVRYLFQKADGTLSDGTEGLDFECVGSFEIGASPTRRLTVKHNDHCHTTALPSWAIPGSYVSFEIACEFGYEITGATVTLADGTSVSADAKGLVMPDGDVTVELETARIVYRVLFTVNGEVYHSAEYFLGETILLPEDPTLANDDAYSYTFSKWDPAVTIAFGDARELVFSAVFSKTLLQGKDPYVGSGNNNRLLTVFLPILLGVIVLAIGAILLLRRHKKKLSLQEEESLQEETPLPEETPLQEESPMQEKSLQEETPLQEEEN